MTAINVEWKYIKSYKLEANLDKALVEAGLNDADAPRYIKVLTPDGRWTAIVLGSEYAAKNGGYAGWGDFLTI